MAVYNGDLSISKGGGDTRSTQGNRGVSKTEE